MRSNFEQLKAIILSHSVSKKWSEARYEWSIVYCHDNGPCSDNWGICKCGYEGIRFEYTIENDLNGCQLDPIGSTCIKQFGVKELKKEIAKFERKQKAIDKIDAIIYDTSALPFSMTRDEFNKLFKAEHIDALHNKHIITDWEYTFLLDTRGKHVLTLKQSNKTKVIIDDILNRLHTGVRVHV